MRHSSLGLVDRRGLRQVTAAMSLKAMIISTDRALFEALAAVMAQEGWQADRMDPAEEDDEMAAPYDLLVFAPHQGDDPELVEFSCAENFIGKPLLWVSNSAPPGMGVGLTRITRLEVLNRLPTMLSRAAAGAPLQPKSEISAPAVAVKEDGAGSKRELKIPTNLSADMIDMRPASVAAAAAKAEPEAEEAPEEEAAEEASAAATDDDEDVDWNALIPAEEDAAEEAVAEEEGESAPADALFGASVDEASEEPAASPSGAGDFGSVPPAAAEARIHVAEAKVGVAEAKAEVAQAEARLMMAEAALMKAQAQLAAFE